MFRLDLAARVTSLSQLEVRVCLDLVVVTLENRAFFVRMVGALEDSPILNARIVLFLLFANIVVVETWCVIDRSHGA